MTNDKTTEQKLAAIIEAQVKNGCDTFETSSDVRIHLCTNRGDIGEVRFHVCGLTMGGPAIVQRHVLQILLDLEGLRAAYGETVVAQQEGKRSQRVNVRAAKRGGPRAMLTNETIAHRILDAWLSGGAESAIDCAYELLPHDPQ